MQTKPDTIKKKKSLGTSVQKKLMIDALQKSLGIVTSACKSSGVSRDRHYTWLKTDSKYKASVDDISEISVDFAESKLLESIKNGSDTATIFYLKTKGKARGYVERTEHDVNLKKGFLDFLQESSVDENQ